MRRELVAVRCRRLRFLSHRCDHGKAGGDCGKRGNPNPGRALRSRGSGDRARGINHWLLFAGEWATLTFMLPFMLPCRWYVAAIRSTEAASRADDQGLAGSCRVVMHGNSTLRPSRIRPIRTPIISGSSRTSRATQPPADIAGDGRPPDQGDGRQRKRRQRGAILTSILPPWRRTMASIEVRLRLAGVRCL